MVDADGEDDFIRLLVQKGTYVIPSLVFEYKLINDHVDEFKQDYLRVLQNPGLTYLPQDNYRVEAMNTTEGSIPRLSGPGFFGTLDRQSEEFGQYQAGYRRLQQFLVKLQKAGGNILAGTDAPYRIPPGISLHHEMQLLVDAGLTPMQVLVDATQKPALAMHKQNTLGTIEAGKLADLLILRANPLDDIRNTRTIETVMKDGRVIDTTFHPSFTNPIPRPFSAHSEPEYNRAPVLQNLLPPMASEGDSDLSLTLQGKSFMKESSVSFDGQSVSTTFVSEQQLKATIPARLFQRVGAYPVTVSTPRPGGGSSEQINFRVEPKSPGQEDGK
jgi:amidohydrolase family protein/IPT/TIG domain-containing protein